MRINARTRSLLLTMGVVVPLSLGLTACGGSNSSDNNDQSDDRSSVTISQEPDQGDGTADGTDNGSDNDNSGVSCDIEAVIGDKSSDTLVEQVGVGLTKGPTAQVYRDNRGTHSGHKNLAFCQKVNVQCFVTNQTGMPSYAPGFYRFEIDGADYYVHSAQFTNGDVLGDASGSTQRDDRVKACK